MDWCWKYPPLQSSPSLRLSLWPEQHCSRFGSSVAADGAVESFRLTESCARRSVRPGSGNLCATSTERRSHEKTCPPRTRDGHRGLSLRSGHDHLCEQRDDIG